MQEKRDIFDRMMALPILNIFEPFYKKNKEVLLYLFFGGLTFIVSIATYAVFNVSMGINELIANVMSWVLAVLFAFATNRVWVFQAPIPYYMFASSYTRQLNVYVTHMMLLVVILFCVMLLLSGLLTFYGSWNSNRRLEQLETAMRRYVQGDYSQSIDTDSFVGTELEQVASLAEQIGSQSGRAEESSRQFVSNVSHELRTPMTIISGFVEGILDGTVPKPKRMEYLSIVSQEVQRLKMLVTSMLNLTKFDAGTIQMNYRMFTLNDTAFRTILMFENRLEKRNIAVEGLDSPPVRVCADPDLIGQVVYNLVENAVKFVNDGGTITFTFADEENDWVFAVRNTGKGISKEELPKIFERFYKSDASRSQDKTGLATGLPVAGKYGIYC